MTIDHRGQVIKYIDPQWHCEALGISNVSLNAVKAAIDRNSKSERTLNVPAIYIDSHYWNDKTELMNCTVTIVSEDGRDAWIMVGKERSKVSVCDLIPVEHAAAADHWLKLDKVWRQYKKNADQAKDALPRHYADSLKALAGKVVS